MALRKASAPPYEISLVVRHARLDELSHGARDVPGVGHGLLEVVDQELEAYLFELLGPGGCQQQKQRLGQPHWAIGLPYFCVQPGFPRLSDHGAASACSRRIAVLLPRSILPSGCAPLRCAAASRRALNRTRPE